jgi:predicted nucleotidyltransferase
MHLTKSDWIAGLPAVLVRDFFRKAARRRSFRLQLAMECFGVNEPVAAKIVQKLRRLEYLDQEGPGEWTVTDKARRVQNASLRQFTRAAAELAFNAFVDRVKAANSSDYLFQVEAIYGFGSFFFGKEDRVSDVDVILILRQRYDQNEFIKRRDAMVESCSRRFSSVVDRLAYPLTQLVMFLKDRSSIIKLHPQNQWKLKTKKKSVYLAPGTVESDLMSELKRDWRRDSLSHKK